ncbi:MAG: anion permease [Oscillospiraceae bacterium]|nr:anion permease [Oscillospiraceae bacterium]
MTVAQIVAIVIFITMFILIISDKIEKHYVTLGCGLLTLVGVFGICMQDMGTLWHVINLESIVTAEFWRTTGAETESGGIDWATILFLGGMMVMVEGMARVGFFNWLCRRIAKFVHYKTIPIFIAFMCMSFVLAMFIDSITVILFLASVTIELSRLLKFNPVPMIMSEIFCANLGGSATMCGDPPNIIIGSNLHYSFMDFVLNTGVVAAISFVFILLYFFFVMRKELSSTGESDVSFDDMPSPESFITDKKGFAVSTVIFLIAVALLITHSTTGLTVAFIGVFIALITLIASGKHILEVLKGVDYKTLLFFTGLFIVVGGLEETGVLEIIANFISKVCGGNYYLMVAIIIWVSGFASAFIDNIPFAATMVPIIQDLSGGSPFILSTLAWSLAMGTDVGGSATPIGASANVVGTSAAAKAGHPIGWGEYCKKMAPATVIVMLISTIYICLRYVTQI